jgi:hypothetical protein
VACLQGFHQGLQLRRRGALDHAVHQRCSTVHGESQVRTARSARGQDGAGGGMAACGPPLSGTGAGGRRRNATNG